MSQVCIAKIEAGHEQDICDAVSLNKAGCIQKDATIKMQVPLEKCHGM